PSLKVPENERAAFEKAAIAETSTILNFMQRHKLSINSMRDLAKVSDLAAQEALARNPNLSPEEAAKLQERVGNLKIIADQSTESARRNEHSPRPRASDVPLDKGVGPIVQGGLKWLGGGPESEGNRAVRSSIQKASSSMKGTGAWIDRGSKVLIAAGVGDPVINQLLSTPNGQQLVIEAGNLSLGSRRLVAILQQLGYGPQP
ncbi:hypothetical protein AB4043_07010, partial [Terriglobus sp. YAF25]|uniref:hypothetical protein n=1 Tax=Terriglobus sp. YAF25 TaxID=3233080 RepID=UPI003F9BF5CF